jgi:hypothetical protein
MRRDKKIWEANIVWTTMGRLVQVGATTLAVGCSGSGEAGAPFEPTALRPAIPAMHSVSGTVMAAAGGAPLPVEGATVDVSNSGGILTATTDALGRYTLPRVSAGSWTVAVRKDGYSSATAEVEVTGSTSLDFVLEPAALSSAAVRRR